MLLHNTNSNNEIHKFCIVSSLVSGGIPFMVRVSCWKMCSDALATVRNLTRHVRDFNVACRICGALSAIHALFECPLPLEMRSLSPFTA